MSSTPQSYKNIRSNRCRTFLPLRVDFRVQLFWKAIDRDKNKRRSLEAQETGDFSAANRGNCKYHRNRKSNQAKYLIIHHQSTSLRNMGRCRCLAIVHHNKRKCARTVLLLRMMPGVCDTPKSKVPPRMSAPHRTSPKTSKR